MKIKPIKQSNSSACGPTCVKMIADYFKVPLTQKFIDSRADYRKDGLSNTDLIRVLSDCGFRTSARNTISWDELKSLNTREQVLVVSWMMKGYLGHFSLVEKVTEDAIYLADPAEGKIIRMNKIIFIRLWMDYDDMDWPEKNTDIQLRWIGIVNKS